jgi:hypothetical protein
MQNVLEKFFVYLSKQLLVSLIIFIVTGFIFIKLYEKFLIKKMSNKFKFFGDRNKEVYFGIFLMGLLFFIIILLIKINYNVPIPFIWLLGSGSCVIGGALGLIPFSFIEKKSNKEEVFKSTGIGGLLGSIVAFLFGFFYVLISGGSKDMPIAIIVGIVSIPSGVLIGIFLGMIVGYGKEGSDLKTKN